MVKLYKVLTFLLQPVGYILLMMCVSSLVMSGFNPQFLLVGAAGICVFIYLFLSFRFVAKTLVAHQPVRAKLKDWIKVNAYVTLLQALFMLFLVAMMLYVVPKETLEPTYKTIYEMVQSQQPGGEGLGSFDTFVKSMQRMFGVVGIVEMVLLVHVVMTLRLLKQYKEYFSE